MEFLLFANHMHDQGSRVQTEIVRTDGSVELVRDDPRWTYEMQFQAEFSRWSLDEPLVVTKGDIVRTTCYWENTTGADGLQRVVTTGAPGSPFRASNTTSSSTFSAVRAMAHLSP